MRLAARVRANTADCAAAGSPPPGCTAATDAPISGRPVEVVLRVRRFFCENADCTTRTCAEQVRGPTTSPERRTGLLKVPLEAIGPALAGRAGARLADKLGMAVSRDSMLRLVRTLPDQLVPRSAHKLAEHMFELLR